MYNMLKLHTTYFIGQNMCKQIQTKHCNYYLTLNYWSKIGNHKRQIPYEFHSLFSHKNDHEK
jgi:hypothetical protein